MHGLGTIIEMNERARREQLSNTTKATELAERIRDFAGLLSNAAWQLDEAARNIRLGEAEGPDAEREVAQAIRDANTIIGDLGVEVAIERIAAAKREKLAKVVG